MKKVIKGRWFPLVMAGTSVLAFVLVLFCLGFRITYASKLENSWDAISASADWAGVIVAIISVFASFLAIWFAIQVPKRIADRQDKIVLFEKRLECYSTL